MKQIKTSFFFQHKEKTMLFLRLTVAVRSHALQRTVEKGIVVRQGSESVG